MPDSTGDPAALRALINEAAEMAIADELNRVEQIAVWLQTVGHAELAMEVRVRFGERR